MMYDPPNNHRAARLRQAGLRVTSARMAILGALEEDRRHPTAEMVFESLREEHPSISLSTVYATLEAFLERGLIRRVSNPAGTLRVDGTPADHDHAICRSCAAVYDIGRDNRRVSPTPAELPPGLRVLDLRIEYEVECPACRTAAAS